MYVGKWVCQQLHRHHPGGQQYSPHITPYGIYLPTYSKIM